MRCVCVCVCVCVRVSVCLRVCQVSNLSQQVAELEGQLDRANRERTSLTNQLEDTLRKLTNQEQESTTVLNGFLKEEITILNYVWFE